MNAACPRMRIALLPTSQNTNEKGLANQSNTMPA